MYDNNEIIYTMINKNQQIMAGVVGVALIALMMNAHPVQASGSGLKVNVFIHSTGCVIGQTADITLSTSRDFTEFKSVVIQAANTVTHFQFAPGEVPNGDSVSANVDVGGFHGFGSVANGPQKAPERIDVDLNCNTVGSGSSSSSASGGGGSESSSSSSSSSTSKICILVRC
jgi:hypothetical protein